MFARRTWGSKPRMTSAASRSTRHTVLIAGAANLFVASIKLAAGILVGSSAMLAEAAHSIADTLNQVFLLTSVNRAERPPDRRHPFGYGQERYFWSLLAAFGIFIAGGGFSVFEGILALSRSDSGGGGLGLAHLALGLSASRGSSLVRAGWQTRRQARERGIGMLEHIRTTAGHHGQGHFLRGLRPSSPVACIRRACAGTGTGSEGLRRCPRLDGDRGLLIGVAFRLGADNRELLIGQAADADQVRVTSGPRLS